MLFATLGMLNAYCPPFTSDLKDFIKHINMEVNKLDRRCYLSFGMDNILHTSLELLQ